MSVYEGRLREPQLDGEAVELRGQKFVIVPFNIKGARDTANARRVLRQVRDGKLEDDSAEAIDAYTKIASVALSTNYPDATFEWVGESFNMRELMKIIKALTAANKDPEAGEVQAPASKEAGAAQ
jgi:hypothetical protein